MAAHPEQKVSVYIALIMIAAIAMTDLVSNGNINASSTLNIALLAFAGGRQLLKSVAGK